MQDLYCSLTLNYWNIPHQNISFLIYQENLTICGDVLLQDNFTVWDPKQLIKKGRERHIFLFEMCLLFAKEMKDNNGKSKYMYKFKLLVSRIFYFLFCHDDVIKWKHLARYWPFVQGIHRSPVKWGPAQRPLMRSFDVIFDLRLNERLSKQYCGWWFETPSCPLWRHSNGSRFSRKKSLVQIWIKTTMGKCTN